VRAFYVKSDKGLILLWRPNLGHESNSDGGRALPKGASPKTVVPNLGFRSTCKPETPFADGARQGPKVLLLQASRGQLPVKNLVPDIHDVIKDRPEVIVLRPYHLFDRRAVQGAYAPFETFEVCSTAGTEDGLQRLNILRPKRFGLVDKEGKELPHLTFHFDDG
jgi:hypothetical protein